ncbi:MAG: hypothetical protein WBA41_08420 [Rivularia sp. (in: cyanobacteria)]
MPEETKKTSNAVTAKQLNQVVRDVGASLLGLPSYVEATVIASGASPKEVVRVTSCLRYLCTALIKNDFDSIKTHCNELEISLTEAQKNRLLVLDKESSSK